MRLKVLKKYPELEKELHELNPPTRPQTIYFAYQADWREKMKVENPEFNN